MTNYLNYPLERGYEIRDGFLHIKTEAGTFSFNFNEGDVKPLLTAIANEFGMRHIVDLMNTNGWSANKPIAVEAVINRWKSKFWWKDQIADMVRASPNGPNAKDVWDGLFIAIDLDACLTGTFFLWNTGGETFRLAPSQVFIDGDGNYSIAIGTKKVILSRSEVFNWKDSKSGEEPPTHYRNEKMLIECGSNVDNEKYTAFYKNVTCNKCISSWEKRFTEAVNQIHRGIPESDPKFVTREDLEMSVFASSPEGVNISNFQDRGYGTYSWTEAPIEGEAKDLFCDLGPNDPKMVKEILGKEETWRDRPSLL